MYVHFDWKSFIKLITKSVCCYYCISITKPNFINSSNISDYLRLKYDSKLLAQQIFLNACKNSSAVHDNWFLKKEIQKIKPASLILRSL